MLCPLKFNYAHRNRICNPDDIQSMECEESRCAWWIITETIVKDKKTGEILNYDTWVNVLKCDKSKVDREEHGNCSIKILAKK